MSARTAIGCGVAIASLLACAPGHDGGAGSTSSGGDTSSTSGGSECATTMDTSSTSIATGSESSSDDGAPLPACPAYAAGESLATVADPAIVEASGLAASRAHPGVLWLHNDSGDGARVFAIGEDGATIAELAIGGAIALDWEDMAIGPGPEQGVDYLYFGDIGDNAEFRANVQIYRVPEPDPSNGSGMLDGAVMLTIDYPDGSHNAETLMVDPDSGDIVIVTKQEGGPSTVFLAAFPQDEAAPIVPDALGELAFGSGSLPGSPLATGGDISPDGATIAVRTYDAVFAWRRGDGATLAEAFATDPCPLPMQGEPQGEAIALTDDAYYTVSEGAGPTLWRFARQ